MNRNLITKILLYTIDKLQDLEAPISTIRLVKYLFIVDMEYYRRRGEILTGLDWIRYSFGPYSFEFPDVLSSLGIDIESSERLTDKGMIRTFKSFGEQRIDDILDYSTTALLDRTIEYWAFESLDLVLDYVYSSGSIYNSKFGDKIDFTKIKKHFGNLKITYPGISSQGAKKISEKIAAIREKEIQPKLFIHYDEMYFQEIEKMNSEDEFHYGISPQVFISKETYQFPFDELD